MTTTHSTECSPRSASFSHHATQSPRTSSSGVCKPGGVIGLVNWTPAGQVGQLLQIMGRYLPAPPSFASPPVAWGDESHVRELFTPYAIDLDFHRGVSPIQFPSAEHYVSFMESNYGPTISARARLLAEGHWETCRAEIIDLMKRLNIATDGTMRVDAEYLVVIATKSR
jgi:hypothetical protein